MPLPPAPTQRASLLATKNIAKFEKKSEPLLPLSSELASAKKPTTKKPLDDQPLNLAPLHQSALATASPEPSKRAPMPVASKKPKATKKNNGPTKLFVLDTNVLMHDPMCLFLFEEHDVYLPMIVLEELDSHKKGMTEVARNARQTSRSLDALAATPGSDMKQGLPLGGTGHIEAQIGRAHV
jgi:PhoH-like ATPase